MDLADAERLAREGIAALRRGDGQQARRQLEAASACPALPTPWLLRAQACRLTGDTEAEAAALARLLEAEPRNLSALLLSGDLNARAGDDRAALSFFQTALNVAALAAPPAALAPLLDRARAFVAAAPKRFEAHLAASLDKAGIGKPAPRIGQALDLLLGKAELYQQQPSLFYFPGLPQRQFFEREEFAWLPAIEAEFPAMRAELDAVLAEDLPFDPYVEATPGRPAPANHLLNDSSWGAMYFWKGGVLVADNAARAPRTVAALAHAPLPVIAERSPFALWSRLEPGTHIAPHHGMLNTRLICHIPLMVPEGCALRVGNETRGWREGEALIFDDSFEHEAWNRGTGTRVVLIFEIWRPELDPDDRAQLTAIFEAINRYQGAPSDPA